MTLTDELANANKARWELARILLDSRVTGDIEALHMECVAAAERLVADAQAAQMRGEKVCVCNAVTT